MVQEVNGKDKITNEEVLTRVGEERTLLSVFMKRKHDWIHVAKRVPAARRRRQG